MKDICISVLQNDHTKPLNYSKMKIFAGRSVLFEITSKVVSNGLYAFIFLIKKAHWKKIQT